MSATTTRRHTAAAPGHHHHRMASSSYSSAATTTFASSSAAFTSPSPTSLLHRSSSPTRVTLSPQPSQSIRFSLDRPVPVSPASNRRVSVSPAHSAPRRTCMCSPTTHPGSFRCSLHKSCGPYGHPAGSPEGPRRPDQAFIAPAAPPRSVPAAAEPAFGHVQGEGGGGLDDAAVEFENF
ncbi:hypothetical protein MLD38_005678 [Melastoma candidum]|uniref:Uncharacterized protein n=1 Tax=Melastoma candidum TaxID=119954 RepID=A0ACB9RPK6_9MYRT|nr:hypothetical protein MLD38_005678 [Melastoma candidum]